jgi:AbrB family looped-hinge helix DNA binding protein
MKAITGAIKARGQLTVPKKIRDMLKLEEGQAVTFLTLGDSVIISPKRLDLDEARR